MDKVTFEEGKITLTKEELTNLLLKSYIRGEHCGKLYQEMKYNKDTSGMKQITTFSNKLFNSFINKLFA